MSSGVAAPAGRVVRVGCVAALHLWAAGCHAAAWIGWHVYRRTLSARGEGG